MSQASFETRGYIRRYSSSRKGVVLTLITELTREEGFRLITSDAYRIILKIDIREKQKK